MPYYPTLYIGLGGSGARTLAYLKRLLQRSVPREVFENYYAFRMFDTDDTEWQWLQNTFAAEFSLDPDFINKDQEWFSLGNFNPQVWWGAIKADPHDPFHRDILAWIDPQTAEGFPNKIVTIGADARRQLGRLCLAHHLPTVRDAILTDIKKLNLVREALKKTDGSTRQLQIIVVTGSCGGTGSSICWDILYLTSVTYQEIAQAAPLLRPVIIAPKPFINLAESKRMPDELKSRYNANACAFFLEFQYAFNRAKTGHYNGAEDFVRPSWDIVKDYQVTWEPFGGALIVDPQREGTPSFIPFDNFYPSLAELLLYLSLSGADATMDKVWTNADADIASTSTGTFPRYLTAGYRALEYPSSILKHYLPPRFLSDLLSARFLKEAAGTFSEGDLSLRAEKVVQETILGPLLGVGAKDHGFQGEVERENLEEPGILGRLQSIDEFLAAGPVEPGETPEVELSTVSGTSLDQSIAECKDEIHKLKDAIRDKFTQRFGAPDGSDPKTIYGRIWDRLQSEMEQYIEEHGIAAWAGSVQQPHGGLAFHLIDAVRKSKNQALEELKASNDRVIRAYGDAEGLEFLKNSALACADNLRNSYVFKGKKSADLWHALDQFAAKRAAIAREAFHNQILMLQVELLSFVGMDGPEVEVIEYFTTYQRPSDRAQTHSNQSQLSRLREQGVRIRSWLNTAAGRAHNQLRTKVASINSMGSSLLTTYRPPLQEITDPEGVPGPKASSALRRMGAMIADIKNVLSIFTGRNWRAVCPGPTDVSEDIAQLMVTGCERWVSGQLQHDHDLLKLCNITIGEYLQNNKGDTELMTQLRKLLSDEEVLVFSPVSDACRNSGTQFRLLVTARAPEEGSAAVLLGYVNNRSQMHLIDATAPERALAIKIYPGLILERDFPWFREIRGFYDRLINYQPHLDRRWRIKIAAGGSGQRWKRAFANSMLWAFNFQGEKWKADPDLRGLFTKRLDTEPNAYLHEPPFALRNKVPYLLSLDLKDEIVKPDGRLELAVGDGDFEKIGRAEQYSTAWVNFMKRPKAVANAEFFHKWCGGVEFIWGDRSEHPPVEIKNRPRAERFLNAVPDFVRAANEKRTKLEANIRKSEVEERIIQVLGWVASELMEESAEIREALGGPTL